MESCSSLNDVDRLPALSKRHEAGIDLEEAVLSASLEESLSQLTQPAQVLETARLLGCSCRRFCESVEDEQATDELGKTSPDESVGCLPFV